MKKFLLFGSIFVVSFLVTYFILCLKDTGKTRTRNVNTLVSSSVLVIADGGYGSGVVFKNGENTYVWTDAHVVAGAQEAYISIDLLTGIPKVNVTYKDVYVSQEIYEQGRKVGENIYLAKIIRYSQYHDIALLKVYKGLFFSFCSIY